MAQNRERAAPRQRTALTQNTKSHHSFENTDTAPETFRQGAPAAWTARRFGLPPAVAGVVAQLAGIGGSP